MTGFGVYVHFPWCRSLCPYCDFAVAIPGRNGIPHTAYLQAVLTELDTRSRVFAGRRLSSIYIGGGTPSLWSPACVQQLIDRIRARFDIVDDRNALEITLEANPSDCTDDNLRAWQSIGIGRLSIGVQSSDTHTLRILGRDHGQGDGQGAVHRAQTSGFKRISGDVIFGVPGSVDGRAGQLDPAVALLADTGIGHLSVYELTIEEHTRFGSQARRKVLTPIEDEILTDIYVAVHHTLAARGFEHYEISSYARPEHRSVHNQLYWRGAEYLGLGNGAASYRRLSGGGGERTTNVRSVKQYVRRLSADTLSTSPENVIAERVTTTAFAASIEHIWLGLRTRDGVEEAVMDLVPGVRDWLVQGGLACSRDGRICPTLQGFLYSNTIAARVVAAGRESR